MEKKRKKKNEVEETVVQKTTSGISIGKVVCGALLFVLMIAGVFVAVNSFTGTKDVKADIQIDEFEYVENVNIGVGEKFNAIINDYNKDKYSWRSLDEDIATVENGVIEGVAIGETFVTIEDDKGNQRTIYVYVNSNNIVDRASTSSDAYVIQYNPNGGKGSISNTTCKTGSSCAVSGNLFTREGYEFSGWISAKDSNGKQYNWTGWSGTWGYKNGQYGIKNNKLVLYAMWTEKQTSKEKFTITYKANGGTGSMKATKCTYGKSCSIKSNEFKRDGYKFDGWVTATTGSGYSWTNWKGTWYFKNGEYGIKDNKLVLYAIWKKDETVTPTREAFTIKYNANGGSGSMANQTCYKGETCTIKANTYTRSGYKFTKWRTTNSISVAGYNWTGWSGTWNFSNGQYGINNNTLTLYATWEKGSSSEGEKFTIKYDANGGSGSMANQTCIYGQSCTIKANTYTRSGYKFTKWRTSSSTSVAAYNWTGWSGTWYFTNGKYGIKNNTLVLYATWEKDSSEQKQKFTITYKANGGSGSMANQTCTYGETCKIKSNGYSYQGYAFKGWTTKKDGTDDGYDWTGYNGTWNFVNGQKGIKDNKLVLYARWKKKSTSEKGWIEYDRDSYTCAVGDKFNVTIKAGANNNIAAIKSIGVVNTDIATIEYGTIDGLLTNCINCQKAHVTCKKAGNTKLKAESSLGATTTASLSVKKLGQVITSIKITNGNQRLNVGDTLKLNLEIKPDGGTSDYTWTSSNESVVSVDQNGKIKAIKAGHADITVYTTKMPYVGNTINVVVDPKEGSVDFGKASGGNAQTVTACGGYYCFIAQYQCNVGDTFSAVVTAYGKDHPTIKSYKSSNTNVVTVNKHDSVQAKCINCLNLKIACKKEGNATLTVTNSSGGKGTIKVVVKKK